MHCHPAPECECDLKSVIGIPFSPAQKIRCGSLNPPPTRRINLPIMDIRTPCQQKHVLLANIYSFVIQNLTQHVHRTSCTFKNHSRL